MNKSKSRRVFLRKSGIGAIAITGAPALLGANSMFSPGSFQSNSIGQDTFPSQDTESVRKVVGASHIRFDEVKELVSARPELAKAVYDWGFGDWESALGAASHMGQKGIAEFLISFGARPNIFTFAMLGKVEAVKSAVEAMPGIQRIRGPHGISLLSHAKNRLRWDDVTEEEKDNGEKTIAYLESLGDADQKDLSLDITEEEQKMFLGKYEYGKGEEDFFTITINSRGMLFISRADRQGRILLRVEDHAFAPGGAPSVRVRFDMEGKDAVALTIHDPVPLVKAVRTKS